MGVVGGSGTQGDLCVREKRRVWPRAISSVTVGQVVVQESRQKILRRSIYLAYVLDGMRLTCLHA